MLPVDTPAEWGAAYSKQKCAQTSNEELAVELKEWEKQQLLPDRKFWKEQKEQRDQEMFKQWKLEAETHGSKRP